MTESKIVTIYPDDYAHEGQLINDYACFGWTLAQRSVTHKTEDGKTSDIEHNLTFQRDYNIPNKDKLDSLFLRYNIKKGEIKKAADAVRMPMRRYVFWFAFVTAIFCGILFPTFYPVLLDAVWNPGLGMKIFGFIIVLLCAAAGGWMLGVMPVLIMDNRRKQNASGNVKGRVYAQMSAIAREAAQYLQ